MLCSKAVIKNMKYQDRFHQLLNFIDSNLDESLTVDTLSEVACLSKYHFHRQFSAFFGITAFSYIKQARMKRASYQLAFKSEMRIIDIAIANGYESSEAFSRAFSQSIGQSPSQFRKQPKWSPWNQKYEQFKQFRIEQAKSVAPARTVKIVDFAGVKVGALLHQGPFELLGDSINLFIDWRKKHALPIEASRTFNIVFADPAIVDPSKYCCYICASVKSDVAENEQGVVTKVIPAGRCAVIRHVGTDDTISDTINYLYSPWLLQNKEELRDDPMFFERVRLFPHVPEAEMITDIYLPLK